MIKIKKWWAEHENAGSRKLKQIRHFTSQSGNDSKGYRKLMRMGQDGLVAFGVFQALCQCMATLCHDARKEGNFSNSDGSNLDLQDISDLTRISADILTSSITTLTDVGWIEALEPLSLQRSTIDLPSSATDLPSISHRLPSISHDMPKGEERRGEEGRGGDIVYDSCPISSNDSDWELIWKNSLKVSRERSSRVKTEKAWKAIKANERPDILDVLNALEAWKASEKWQGGFAEGIHIWIKDKQWLNIPEAHDQKEQPVQRRSAV